MLEHIAGRPNVIWKRNQTILVILFWLWRVLRGDSGGPRIFWFRRINRALTRFTPWQIIVTTLSTVYAVRNADGILGLGSPEPLAHLYSPDFYRATWITTALDAGFATAMPIYPRVLRDIASVVFFLYYLVFAREADEKLRRFRAICTVEMLRTTWEKTTNPIIRAVTHFDRPPISIFRRVLIPRPEGSPYQKPVIAWLFFAGSEVDLVHSEELVLDIPGGGFICMTPRHHEERLRRWALRTGRPVLSLEYGKAPEYPFPWALNEAFDVYRVLFESKGRAIGMSGRSLRVIISGDSAGANLVVALTCKIIEQSNESPSSAAASLPRPTALVLAYPALDFNFSSWMSPTHLQVLRTEQSSTNIHALAEQKDHYAHRSPLAVVRDVRRGNRSSRLRDSGKDAKDAKGQHGRKKSWTSLRQLSGTLKSLASPLSPVTKRGGTLNHVSNTNSRAPNGMSGTNTASTSAVEKEGASARKYVSTMSNTTNTLDVTPAKIAPGANSKQPTGFKARMHNRVSELDSLAVNTDFVSPSSSPTKVGGGSNQNKNKNQGQVPQDPQTADADYEDNDSDDADDADYYRRMADQDKPLSARVLFSEDDDDGELMRRGRAHGQMRMEIAARKQEELELAAAESTRIDAAKKLPIGTRLTMTSRAGYFQDRIVSPSMMRAMAILYIGPKRNPDMSKDYYISPILIPAPLLVEFPRILLICGEKDPFVDDTVIFGGRIREAKRVRQAELRARTGGEALRMSTHSTPVSSSNNTQKDREKALLNESDPDWVDMRILEGWGHGFLQMSASIMLGENARNVIWEMGDWISDTFSTTAKSTIKSHESQIEDASAIAKRELHRTRSPPLRSPPTVTASPGRRGSSTGTTQQRTKPSPPSVTSSLHDSNTPSGTQRNNSSPTKAANTPNSELPPISSETETERDGPLTFTIRKKGGDHTPRSSFGNGSVRRESFNASLDQRRPAIKKSSSGETAVGGASTRGSSPSALAQDGQGKKLPPVSSPLQLPSPVSTPATFSSGLSGVSGSAGSGLPTSPKPAGAVLLSEAELMRRRRVDAVFGLGESGATEAESKTRNGGKQSWNVPSSTSSMDTFDGNLNGV